MTFDEALVQLEIAVREHGVAVEDLLARLRTGEILRERFVSEMRPLQQVPQSGGGGICCLARRPPRIAYCTAGGEQLEAPAARASLAAAARPAPFLCTQSLALGHLAPHN
jgi:hypothetical protein